MTDGVIGSIAMLGNKRGELRRVSPLGAYGLVVALKVGIGLTVLGGQCLRLTSLQIVQPAFAVQPCGGPGLLPYGARLDGARGVRQ